MDKSNKKILLLGATLLRALAMFCYSNATGATLYIVARVLHGLSWSFMGVATIAIVAASVNPAVVGTASALASFLGTVSMNYVRPFVSSQMNASGVSAVANTCYIILAVQVVLILALNEKKLSFASKDQKRSLNPFAVLKKLDKKIFLISLVGAFPVIAQATDSIYLPVIAAEKGIEITAALTVGATIGSVMAFLAGFCCDIIDGKKMFFITSIAYAVGCAMEGLANTTGLMFVAICLMYIGSKFAVFSRTIALKMVDKSQLGMIAAISALVADFMMMLSSPFVGYIADNFSMTSAFVLSGGLVLISVGLLVYLMIAQKREESAQLEP